MSLEIKIRRIEHSSYEDINEDINQDSISKMNFRKYMPIPLALKIFEEHNKKKCFELEKSVTKVETNLTVFQSYGMDYFPSGNWYLRDKIPEEIKLDESHNTCVIIENKFYDFVKHEKDQRPRQELLKIFKNTDAEVSIISRRDRQFHYKVEEYYDSFDELAILKTISESLSFLKATTPHNDRIRLETSIKIYHKLKEPDFYLHNSNSGYFKYSCDSKYILSLVDKAISKGYKNLKHPSERILY